MPKKKKPETSSAKRKPVIRKPDLSLHFKPLGKNQFKSKLYGLTWLKAISKKTGAKALEYNTFRSAREFSMKKFKNLEDGRLIIRTDPYTKSQTQSMQTWVGMPRLNFYLKGKNPAEAEKNIKKWMAEVKQKRPNTIFIVHKVRPLQDYERSVQINIDLKKHKLFISTSKAGTDKFRDENVKSTEMMLDENQRVRREIGKKIVLPEPLQKKTIMMARELTRIAEQTGCPTIEASYVTYKESPYEPEYYDLIFGKSL